MKGVLIFIIGFAAGVFVTIKVIDSGILADESYDGLYGLTIFSEKGECIPTANEMEVLQVVKPNMALTYTDQHIGRQILVLLINYDGKTYYDDQKIKVPSGKCARQIGTYQYTTNMNMNKTVPAVVIE